MNYFELFDLPVAPVVDRTVLAKKYFELQKQFHPDFFTNEAEEDKEHALQQSAAINKAFKIFQQPDLTIEYFLQQKGIISPDEKYSLPNDFLMEMMELNEDLSEEENGIKERISKLENELYQHIEPVLKNYDPTKSTDTELEKLKEYFFKKKYIKRILERFDD